MRPTKILLLFFMITSLPSGALAEVNLQMGFYNSDDKISVGLFGEDLRFDAGITLTPESLSYNNGGASIGQDGFYSYQVVLNGEKITLGAKTDSGSFGWSTNAFSDLKGGEPSQLVVNHGSKVQNGTMYTYCTNSDYRIDQTMHAFNATSGQAGLIMLHQMSSMGTGKTAENSASQFKGFQDTINVTNLVGEFKPANISLNVNGDTESQWQYFFKSSPTQYSFGQSIIGIMRPSDANNLSMQGDAAGFPTQVLPISGLNMSYQLNDGDYDKGFGRLDAEVNESINQSKGIYQIILPKDVPVYSFDQKDLANPTYINATGKSIKTEMFYRLSMQFKVNV